MTPVRQIVPVFALAACGAALPCEMQAQRVFGRVTEADGRTGITGVVVTLVQDTVRLAPVLSGADGRFFMRAPAAGRWQVRADAIGRPSQYSPPLTLAASDTARVELRFPPFVPTLEMVRVAGERGCRMRPDEGERMAEVWQAIRTALEASAATERERRTPLELEVTDYRMDLFKQRTSAAKLTLRSWSGAGFFSAPPDELVARGYVRQIGDSVAYFAPDANVITSPSFLATHCFRVEEQAPLLGARQVGLSFQPLQDRVVGDVRGTLWLDAQSAALRRLELEYVVPGRTSSLPNADATMEYARLPNGRWFVSRWLLNMPVVREVGPRVGGVSSVAFSGWRAREGLARALSLRDAQRLAPPAVVFGQAMDSTTGRALVGAEVLLEGVGRTTTDSAGHYRFEVRDPLTLPAPATLTLLSGRARELGVEAPVRELSLVAGDTAQVELAIPSVAQLRKRWCGEGEGGEPALGVLSGRVTGYEMTRSAQYVAFVILKWLDTSGMNHSNSTPVQWDLYGAGRFVLCGVPVGVPIRVHAESRSARSGEQLVTIDMSGLGLVPLVLHANTKQLDPP